MLFLLCQIGQDRLAIPARQVIEVLPLVTVNSLCATRSGVAGIMPYRGSSILVLDLSLILTGRAHPSLLSTRIVVVKVPLPGGASSIAGLIAERATETKSLQPDHFRKTSAGQGGSSLVGPVAWVDGAVIQRLELEALETWIEPPSATGAAA